MPKLADHGERRAQIAEALLRIAGSKGLHAVTMRSVAAEAGFAVAVVQYYFESKEKLLLFALQHLAQRMGERVRERVGEAGSGASPLRVVETILGQAVPADEESRIFHLVYTSYAVLSVTDPALAAQPFLAAPNLMQTFIADRLREARDTGEIAAGLDPESEAAVLLTMSAGLGTSVLLGQRTAEQAMDILRYHLTRIAASEH
ncbi:TetR/AcrR family transcriptional regulator [Microbispora sp. RL4-1S]|uniref:TetR/AcrR family transcriptional regulator n=1 Tax=Microbispora oryzae TaxID=2806554 RepID=A0A940WSA0_9ACTN|nr:TetR/AcrR family transcriptional regulator [Microbispora oryzae]MBP2706119.1 TetR/AcrR family transcriptional regulator [Microbispora oryzae]